MNTPQATLDHIRKVMGLKGAPGLVEVVSFHKGFITVSYKGALQKDWKRK